jgi:hypothetical protein
MLGSAPLITLLIFLFPPLYAVVLRFIHGKNKGGLAPWRYFYSVLVYLTSIPGTFIAVVTAYLLFIQGANLVELDLLAYFLPVLSMVVTLILIRMRVDFKDIPGFKRLSGLLVMLAGAFLAAFIIDRLRIFVVFYGSIVWLFVLALIIFMIIKGGAHLLFKKRKKEAPE